MTGTAPPGSSGLRASVCVPTRDRRDLALRLLDALSRQTIGPDAFEVIVADDGSTDGTTEAIRAAATEGRWRFPVRVIELAPGGPAAARNAAVKAARGEVIAFIDSDVVPDPGWLEAGLEAFGGGGRVGAVEGTTVVRERERVTPFTHQTENSGGRYPTCNLLVLRSAFEAAGGFDASFGGRHFFREDSDLAFRLLDGGWRIALAPKAVVDHPPLPGRLSTPLRLARRYRYDPLLKRKHPRRFARELDVHAIFGRRVARVRQRVYAANVAAFLALCTALALGLPAGWLAAIAAAYAATYGLVFAAHRPWRAGNLLEAVVLPGVAFLVPFVYAVSWVEGCLLARRGRAGAATLLGSAGARPAQNRSTST